VVAVFAWYRALFRGALRHAMNELGALLQGVEQQLQTQRLFRGETTPALGGRTSPWSTQG